VVLRSKPLQRGYKGVTVCYKRESEFVEDRDNQNHRIVASRRLSRNRGQPILISRAGGILKRDIVTIQCLQGDSAFQGVTKGGHVMLGNVTKIANRE